jgi:Protein phosphatase 2C
MYRSAEDDDLALSGAVEPIASVARAVNEHARMLRVNRMLAVGELSLRDEAFDAAAVTTRGMFRGCTESVVLLPICVGATRGVLAAVCAGNYKDESGGVASAIIARALLDAFVQSLPGESDVAPTLQRAFIAAHDGLLDCARAHVGALDLWTVMGEIGWLPALGATATAAVILPHRAWTAHIGDGVALLVRDGAPRRLTFAHTLGHHLAPRSSELSPWHASILVRLLAMQDEPTTMDLGRVDLSRGARLVLGNCTLDRALDAGLECGVLEPDARSAAAKSAALGAAGIAASRIVIDLR